MTSSRYDLVVFGASGFTGQFVVQYVAKAAQNEQSRFTWAIAGRSHSKLEAVLAEAGKARNEDLSGIPIILADTGNDESLRAMARQAVVVLNCVGPYRFFGEQVVKACVAEGAHHLDISGEPQYLETMQLKYNDEATRKGVYVIGACGFDSIPSDVGQMYLTKKMGGDVNDIETYLQVVAPEGVAGPKINFGTWQSAIYGFAKGHELGPLRKQLFPEKLPKVEPKLKRYELDEERPTQIGCYVQMSSLFAAICTLFVGAVFGLLASFKFGRSLLEDYPGVFSFGLVTKKGPSKEMIENTNFVLTLVGRGWKDKVDENGQGPLNRKVTVTVSGKNIGYGSTCECIVQAALVVLQEKDQMPGGKNGGGVYTPGYAFKNTTIVERLNQNEVFFTAKSTDL